ncbi:carbamate kinase [Pseudomonas abyssi]|jgi:carbamate kinase|uniref:Carbamate kinase n=1 Tax=Pseudomonas abyssi TaxID=170540 RepID=A0A2A3MCY8_9PSED|nr:carbamate kinase [Pseudomonas abyssi]MAC99457.1 carbamate kinase [Pseudomonadales bacterium]PBK02661.1 carbamate kinase [Pseudomonas abyssi]|tara:strand:- start:31783 stop:32685 length:903 start_codon:yes stop_codon:yes gene_type:complete
MLIVVALGGNALLKRGEAMTAETQRANVNKAAAALAELVREGHQLVITHGNGPQVGLLALQGAAYRPSGADPLDVLGAETEGMIGYMIEQELENAIDHHKPVATLLTQVVVDIADSAFQKPTKFVGPVYDKAEAERRAAAANWSIAQDGDKWRRVVPSPAPLEIPDLSVLKILLRNEVIVICAGGGGIPVVRKPDGSLVGVEAVIDKDAASALLAEQIGADALLLLTDVDAVYRDFGTHQAQRVSALSVDDLDHISLPAGSMLPKAKAAARFAGTGKIAAIGRLEDASSILRGSAGTRIG